ncbi:MAG: glycine cleavage T C-terminal barrel domain-containing protein [Chloroflexota bacterium]
MPIIDEKGGILNDPVLLRLAEDHFWLSLADSDVLLYAKGLAAGHNLDVTVDEPDVSPLAIQGPRANDVAAALLGEWVRDLRFFRFKEFNLDGIPLVVARSGWSKQGGIELYLRDGRQGVRLWEMVEEAGKPFDIAPATPSTIERIESGLLSYGNDMTIRENPYEVGLGAFCDVDQEFDFIGKTALKEILAQGVKRQIVGLVIDSQRLGGASHYWPLSQNGEELGYITSAIFSPRLEKNIALALVPIEYSAEGTLFTAHTEWGDYAAVVHPVPFG